MVKTMSCHSFPIKILRVQWSVRVLLVFVACMVFSAFALSALFIRPAINALNIERRIQAALTTIRVVDRYIQETSTWPTSWEDLEGVQWRDHLEFDWPKDVAEIQRLVEVDFRVLGNLDDTETCGRSAIRARHRFASGCRRFQCIY